MLHSISLGTYADVNADLTIAFALVMRDFVRDMVSISNQCSIIEAAAAHPAGEPFVPDHVELHRVWLFAVVRYAMPLPSSVVKGGSGAIDAVPLHAVCWRDLAEFCRVVQFSRIGGI